MTTAEIHRIWADFDVTVDGQHGIVIHSGMTIRGYNVFSGRGMSIIYWFYFTDNSPIPGGLPEYTDVAGNACTAEDFVPPYTASTYDDFRVFLPYEALKFDRVGYLEAHCNLGIYEGNMLVERRERVLVFGVTRAGGYHQSQASPPKETPRSQPPPSSPKGQYQEGDIWTQLGIPKNASKQQKKRMLTEQYNSYRARVNHPDLNKRQEAERMLVVIAKARQSL